MQDFSDIRQELLAAADDAYAEGFLFSVVYGPAGMQASLTNQDLGDIPALRDGSEAVVFDYGLTQTDAERLTYRTELIRAGDALAFRRSEMGTGRVLGEVPLPPPHHSPSHDDHEFETINDCIADFEGSDYQAELRKLANETCHTQFGHLHCCLKTGDCYSVVIVVRPTSWRCLATVAHDPAEVFAPLNG